MENPGFFSLSFPTISATGSNASIIHYNPKPKSSILKDSQLYLCDSGGQYYGGTTDITRTIHLGEKTYSKNKRYLHLCFNWPLKYKHNEISQRNKDIK